MRRLVGNKSNRIREVRSEYIRILLDIATTGIQDRSPRLTHNVPESDQGRLTRTLTVCQSGEHIPTRLRSRLLLQYTTPSISSGGAGGGRNWTFLCDDVLQAAKMTSISDELPELYAFTPRIATGRHVRRL